MMEMTIDEKFKILQDEYAHLMGKYQMMQADYKNRLKADLVTILTEIQLEIEKLDFFEGEEPINITQALIDEVGSWEYGVNECKGIIQQKINSLKSKNEPQESEIEDGNDD